MSVELDGWTAFKAAITGNTALVAYYKTWRPYRTAFQFQPAQHPVLMAWPESILSDAYLAFPKRKKVELKIVVSGIVKVDGELIENELLHFDALIKNALETDIKLGGKAIIINISDSKFTGLSEGVALVQIVFTITLPILTAGSR